MSGTSLPFLTRAYAASRLVPGIRGGMVHVVAGSLFAQIERERRDGPRWSLALREGRRLRERAAGRLNVVIGPVYEPEWRKGVPVGWWGRMTEGAGG